MISITCRLGGSSYSSGSVNGLPLTNRALPSFKLCEDIQEVKN